MTLVVTLTDGDGADDDATAGDEGIDVAATGLVSAACACGCGCGCGVTSAGETSARTRSTPPIRQPYKPAATPARRSAHTQPRRFGSPAASSSISNAAEPIVAFESSVEPGVVARVAIDERAPLFVSARVASSSCAGHERGRSDITVGANATSSFACARTWSPRGASLSAPRVRADSIASVTISRRAVARSSKCARKYSAMS